MSLLLYTYIFVLRIYEDFFLFYLKRIVECEKRESCNVEINDVELDIISECWRCVEMFILLLGGVPCSRRIRSWRTEIKKIMRIFSWNKNWDCGWLTNTKDALHKLYILPPFRMVNLPPLAKISTKYFRLSVLLQYHWEL